jgi:hypothetical protein
VLVVVLMETSAEDVLVPAELPLAETAVGLCRAALPWVLVVAFAFPFTSLAVADTLLSALFPIATVFSAAPLAVPLTAVVVFPVICRKPPAEAEVVVLARSALLTEAVFKDAAEVRWVVLTAPSLIWAVAECPKAKVAPATIQIAITFFVRISSCF